MHELGEFSRDEIARTNEQNYTHVYDASARGEKDGMLVYRRADAITEAWKDTGIVLI